MAKGTYCLTTTNYKNGEKWICSNGSLEELGCMEVYNVYPEFQYQEIRGFGGAFTESAGYCFKQLSEDAKEKFIQAYFSEEGLNYNIGRTHINSCDFSLENYAYVEDASDTDFDTFSLKRAEEYVLPLIRKAQDCAGKEIELLVSPWSPPAFMKTNGEMNHGGKLKPEYREAWARYMARYIKEMQKLGFDIRYITPQNEPDAVQTWDSCQYNAQEEMEFVRDYLGPVFEEEGLGDIKIVIWDHNKEILFERADAILSDAEAAKYIAGIGMHWYTGDHFEAISLVQQKYPGKEVLFTEGCVEYSRFDSDATLQQGEMYAHDILGDLKHGTTSFCDWNLLLDAKGGPNHVGNFCAAPIMLTEDGTDFVKQVSYYYIGHFSRFIKPGAVRIATTQYNDAVECLAVLNPDGQRVVVLLNRTDKKVACDIKEAGIGKRVEMEPHTIATLCYTFSK